MAVTHRGEINVITQLFIWFDQGYLFSDDMTEDLKRRKWRINP